MALTRRSTSRITANIWPGFVDAVTSLLMVMTFLLTIFIVVQYVLREEISGQQSELDDLSSEVAGLERRAAALERERADLSSQTEAQSSLIGELRTDLDAQRDQIAASEAEIRSLTSERDAANETVAELEAEQAALSRALASARDEIDAQAEQARLAASRREALEALTARLESEADDRADRVADLESELTEEERARAAEAAAAEELGRRLRDSEAELSTLSLAMEEERRRAEETLTLLAAADAARADLTGRLAGALAATEAAESELNETEAALAEAEGEEADLQRQLEEALALKLAAEERAAETQAERDSQAALLNQARTELSRQEEEAVEARREAASLDIRVRLLQRDVSTLRSLLDVAEEEARDNEVEIDTLGQRLNAALVREAEQQKRRAELEAAERERLESYRSDFFGRLREVLGDRDEVEIVGDRFVFDSEVLFSSGSAVLSPEGRAQVAQVASFLDEVSGEIPDGIDWVVRVDGHTDDVPISQASRFADNWELSQARALSVVRFMADELGFPEERLAPTGFGEYRPVDGSDTAEARARNRRIELKLTER